MPNVLNMVPKFSNEDEAQEEVKEAVTEEATEEVKETPSELPAEEKPAADAEQDSEKLKQLSGLNAEVELLKKQIVELRGQRRELKEEKLIQVQDKIDHLKDVNPADVELLDKWKASKGVVSKDEVQQMFYDAVKQEELAKFLDEFPEYKPENDPQDLNWSALQREFSLYARPQDPHLIGSLLRKSRQGIARVSVDRSAPQKKQAIKTASVGSGGAQRSSESRNFSAEQVVMLRRGGYSEEDIERLKTIKK